MYLPRRSGRRSDGATRNGLPPIAQRRLLGETDIHPDGSFHISIPANTPIQLQTLDENGMALRSCGWIWSKNAEPRGCIGCHEDGESTPENAFVDALRRPAVALTLPPERRRTVDFRRDVMPIIEQKCVACHAQDGAPPRLDGGLAPLGDGGRLQPGLHQSARAAECRASRRPADGLYVHPGRARTSPLIWHCSDATRPGLGMVSAVNGQPAKPIPPGKVPPLTNLETRVFVEWVDMGAMWDGIPGPDEFSDSQPAGGANRGEYDGASSSAECGRLSGAGRLGHASAQEAPVLTDVTAEAGITFHQRFGDDNLSNIVEGTGAGAMFFDYDGDGWLDIYFVCGTWNKDVNDNRGRKVPRQALQSAVSATSRTARSRTSPSRRGWGIRTVSALVVRRPTTTTMATWICTC